MDLFRTFTVFLLPVGKYTPDRQTRCRSLVASEYVIRTCIAVVVQVAVFAFMKVLHVVMLPMGKG